MRTLKGIPPTHPDAAHARAEDLPVAVQLFAVRSVAGCMAAFLRGHGRQARWKHGAFSAEARQEMAHFRQLLRECKELEELMNR